MMTAEQRATLVEALINQVSELAQTQNRSPEEILADMHRHLLIQRFRGFVSRNQAKSEKEGWKESDVLRWIEEDRRGFSLRKQTSQALFKQGLGLFGRPEDVAIIDEVVAVAYEERRRES